MSGTSRHPGPSDLNTHQLTRNELGAMLEHLMYRARGDTRSDLAKRMPDAYQRLMNLDDATMALLTSRRIAELRAAGLAQVDADPTYNNGSNGHARDAYRERLGAKGVSG